MSVALRTHRSQPRRARSRLRYALRELRGGLRGFYVFIACIALGVMAIAGVGSVAASLSEGLAREGRTLLGGDVAFALIQREAKPDEVAFLRSRGERIGRGDLARHGAQPATAGSLWSSSRRSTATIPMLGQLTLTPEMPLADLLAERDGAFGAAADRDPAGAARSEDRRPRHHRQRHLSDPQRRRRRAGQARRRHRPRSALPGRRGRFARHRAVAARQPGALDLSGEAAGQCRRRSRHDCADRRCAEARCREAGWEIRSRSQRLAAARAHHQPLHPISHAGRPRRASGRRRRRRQRGQEPYRSPPRRDRGVQGAGRHRPRRVRDLPRRK